MHSLFSVKEFANRLLFVLFFVSAFGVNLPQFPSIQSQQSAKLDRFDFLTDTSGWILLDDHLFWTSDTGQTWSEVGPAVPPDASIEDVEFINASTGWILWTKNNVEDGTNFELAQTINRGVTWTVRSLPLFELGEIGSYAEKAEMGWFDVQTGWISVKQASGSNFSLGTLFTTSDGGNNWHRIDLPTADKIYFSSSQDGWAIGGPAGDQLFHTRDAGASWKSVVPADNPEGAQVQIYPPHDSADQSVLVTTVLGEENTLNVYSRGPNSDEWLAAGKVDLFMQPGLIALSILDSQDFVTTLPGTTSMVRMKNGQLDVLENQDGLASSIVELDMLSLELGWAKSLDSTCVSASSSDLEAASVSCSSTTRLLRTSDGGLTWQIIRIPAIAAGMSTSEEPAASDAVAPVVSAWENTETFIGQGFDRCEIPALSQMQTWWEGGPYKTVNLYIGGSNRACSNTSLISSYLFLLNQQGWKFFPTWVGPQAPCSVYSSRMSYDVTTAYAQGVSEANLAVERLAELGLTGPEKTGSVVYYDIENYGTNTTCRAAVNAFMNGWVSQIHVRGSLAGVYGSTLCNTGLSDFLNIPNVPDLIWPARWYHSLGYGYYDPNASVWNLGSCIPNTVWVNHQRIRQYEGDHDETWGDLTLNIDSNVLDGVVAVPYDYPYVSSIIRSSSNPTGSSHVAFTVTFSKSVTGVDGSDFVLTTDLAGAFVSSASGSGATYTVTVNTGSGNGTIRLDVVDNDSIKDANNHPLGGSGNGNGNYSSGQTYTISKYTFNDVPDTYWAWSYIERLYAAGVTSGCGGGNFCPTATVTRDQMAVFLLKGKHGLGYVPPTATGVFADVPSNYWAAAWIEQLAAEGITSGCSVSPQQYCPTTPVTRDQMAIFLLKAKHGSGYVPPAPSGVFADVPTNYWAAAWIEQLAAEGITSGCGGGNYCPTTPVSRDQMAVFLVKNFNLP